MTEVYHQLTIRRVFQYGLTLIFGLSSFFSFSVARYWIANTPSNWNNSANWSTSAGGSATGGIPGTTDHVYFTSTKNGHCTIDAVINIAGMDISGYSGTITNSNYYFTISNANYFTQSSGTFNGGSSNISINNQFRISGGIFTCGSGTLDVNSGFYLSGGTFNSTSGNFTHSGLWEHTAGTFNHNNGTVIFDGAITTSNQKIEIPSNTETFYNLKFAATSGTKLMKTVNDNIIILGTLTFESGSVGTWVSGAYTLEAKGNVTALSTFGTIERAILKFSGTANQNFDLSSATDKLDNEITINKSSGDVNLISALTMNAGENLNLTLGTLNLNGQTLTNSGSTYCTGTFTVSGTGTVNNYAYNQTTGSPALTISGASTFIFGTGQFTQSTGTFNAGAASLDFNGNFNLTGGTFTASSGNMYFSKDWNHTSSGTFNHNSGTVIFDGSYSWPPGKITMVGNTESFYNLTFNIAAGSLCFASLNKSLIVSNQLNLYGGEIGSWSGGNPNTLDARGDVTVSSTFIQTSADITILFSGSASVQNFDLTGAAHFVDGHIQINKSAGEVKLLSNLMMNSGYGQNFTFNSGTFNLNGKTVDNTSGGFIYVNTSTSNISGTGNFKHGNYSQSGGTLNITGTSTMYLYSNFAITGGTFNGSTGTLDIDGSFNLSTGTFNAPSGNMYVGKAWDHPSSGSFYHNFGTVTFDGNYNNQWFIFDYPSTETYFNVNYNHPNCSGYNKMQSGGDIMIVEGNLNLISGWIYSRTWEATTGASTNIIKVRGNVTIGSAYCNGNDPPNIIFICGDNQNLDLTGASNNFAGNYIINKTGGSVKLISNITLYASQSFIIGNGTLDLNGYTLTLGTYTTLYKYNGGTLTYNGGSLSGGSLTNTGTNYTPDGFSCGILPVKFLFIKAEKINNSGLISWATVSEINNDYFEIEKSLDGKIFFNLGKVKGYGNSQQIINYSFTDLNYNNQSVYYRLKQIDFDGKETYSAIVSLKNENNFPIVIWPIPAHDFINIALNHSDIDNVKIMDAQGKVLIQSSMYSNTELATLNMDVSDLNNGMYYLYLFKDNVLKTVKIFSVQK